MMKNLVIDSTLNGDKHLIELVDDELTDFIYMLQAASNCAFQLDEYDIQERIDEWLFENIPEDWL